MDIIISVLGRAAVADPFAVLGSQTVQLTGDTLAVTPDVPAEAAGQELHVRVYSALNVNLVIGAFLDEAARPADAERVIACKYSVTAGKPCEAPLPIVGGSLILAKRHVEI
ncbi:hypothetical protein MKK75_03780 [Methylobacterium sp. J-030]|uniref:hypothetical protein n=1 Tax=Methylobacterium sp. J-030 TaxID=2836627 RepID=UPI001FBB9281|nr:hypothetical protein [Methylobacterium sp. J-030]MCJ2067935.1 hypothetical protein [Methylobacterium sp. J-030]